MSAMIEELNVRYLEDGRAVHVVESLNHGGSLVLKIKEDPETGEEFTTGKPFVAYDLFAEPPLDKIHAEVKAAEERLADLRHQAAEMHKAVYDAQREQRENLKRIEDATAIRDIDRVLRGEYQYIVVDGYDYPSIVKAEEATYNEGSHWNREMKLRALMLCFRREEKWEYSGQKPPRLRWWLSQYSDGSGGADSCTLHFDYESARARAQEILDEGFKRKPDKGVGDAMISFAEKHGLTLPADKVERHKRSKLENAQKAVDVRKADLAKAEAELKEIQQ